MHTYFAGRRTEASNLKPSVPSNTACEEKREYILVRASPRLWDMAAVNGKLLVAKMWKPLRRTDMKFWTSKPMSAHRTKTKWLHGPIIASKTTDLSATDCCTSAYRYITIAVHRCSTLFNYSNASNTGNIFSELRSLLLIRGQLRCVWWPHMSNSIRLSHILSAMLFMLNSTKHPGATWWIFTKW